MPRFVESAITDAWREAASAVVPALNLPDAVALDQFASHDAASNVVRGDHRVRAFDGSGGNLEDGGQDRDWAKAFGGFDIDACEADAARRAVA